MDEIKKFILKHNLFIIICDVIIPCVIFTFVLVKDLLNLSELLIFMACLCLCIVYNFNNILLVQKKLKSLTLEESINYELLNPVFSSITQYIILNNYIIDMKKLKVIKYDDIISIEIKNGYGLIHNTIVRGELLNIVTKSERHHLFIKLYGNAKRSFNVFESLDTFILNKNPNVKYINKKDIT